jgi:phosphoribosylanthranilate isomerase
MRPEIKVCGVCDPAFAVAAARAGVDYLGFIFAPSSPRFVTEGKAAEIVKALEGVASCRVRKVGVFVLQGADEILGVMRRVGLDVVQLHRRASEADVAALRAAGFEVWSLAGGAPGDGVLFDSSHGDGESAFARGQYKSIVAGGIGEENVGEALALKPDVIDVNSTLETAPGVKSEALLVRFLEKARALSGACGKV